MSEGEKKHPLQIGIIAVVATITVCSGIFFTWVAPTLTASVNHELTLTKERLSAETERSALHKRAADEIQKRADAQNDASRSQIEQLKGDLASLREKLFVAEMANSLTADNPYPAGIDAVKIGDLKTKVAEEYDPSMIEETGRNVAVKRGGDLFRRVVYRHSSTDKTKGIVDDIVFDLSTFERIRDSNLPRIPKGWLESALKRSLGEPMVVGTDSNCLMWKTLRKEVVYFQPDRGDRFSINGLVSYPAGCDITDEQIKRYRKP
ncbi:hypothetical protein RPMA_09650 [Tardiphaga alba]|uniref:Uncharacterized protein n=1 Tax=Tardiphaga alba TaxID=340268 RepID=A0ABX8A5Q7_9BRAD|nr:hypothetical protein [Tardiphaga alba]QUS39068.1 hypothetical protein RPMA_09650 [Tardiphaga alba]